MPIRIDQLDQFVLPIPTIAPAGYKPCPLRVNSWLGDYPESDRERLSHIVLNQEKRLASHEAGHAVMGVLLGAEVQMVTITENGRGWGGFARTLWFRSQFDWDDSQIHRRRIIQAMAGPVAEFYFKRRGDFDNDDPSDFWEDLFEFLDYSLDSGDSNNIDAALSCLASYFGWSERQRYQWKQKFWIRTESIVTKLSPVIESLAAELLVKKDVEGVRVHELVEAFPERAELQTSLSTFWAGLRRRKR